MYQQSICSNNKKNIKKNQVNFTDEKKKSLHITQSVSRNVKFRDFVSSCLHGFLSLMNLHESDSKHEKIPLLSICWERFKHTVCKTSLYCF